MKNILKKLETENNMSIKKLTENQQKEIDSIIKYVRAKGISLFDSELFRKDRDYEEKSVNKNLL